MIKGSGKKLAIKQIICGVLTAALLIGSVDVRAFASEPEADQIGIVEENSEADQEIDIEDASDLEDSLEDVFIEDESNEGVSLEVIDDDLIDSDGATFDGGSGTEDDPYLISTVNQLKSVSDSYNSWFKLTKDLTLNEYWTPISCVELHFDGGGHTIYNLKINGGSSLLGNVSSVKNLTIENAEITDGGSAIASFADIMENCKLKGNVHFVFKTDASAIQAGGMVYTAKNISNCENYAKITVELEKNDSRYVQFGGIACYAWEAKNLVNKEGSSIVCDGRVGGIAQTINTSAENCVNYADIVTNGTDETGQDLSGRAAAGIAIFSHASFNKCRNYGNVSAASTRAAGLVLNVHNSCTFKNCSNEGEVTSYESNGIASKSAGIVLNLDNGGTIEGCYNRGTITGVYASGIVGEANGPLSISTCFNEGKLVTTAKKDCWGGVGGIAQNLGLYKETSVIKDCYNSGVFSISGEGNIQAGGIVSQVVIGGISVKIENCYNNFSFEAFSGNSYNKAAGIIGESQESKDDSGYRFATENCYSLDKGYACARFNGNDEDETYKAQVLKGLKKCTDDELKKQSTYEGFDFGSVWLMGTDDYPYPMLIGVGGVTGGYEITLDPNGGTVSTTTVYTNKYGKLASLPYAKKENKKFLGWYLAKDGDDRVDKNYVFEGDTTLYAHWGDYDETKKLLITPQDPVKGARGVAFLSINPASGTNASFDIKFQTNRHVTGADFEAGTVKIYAYDANGNLGSAPVFTLNKNNAKVTFKEIKEKANTSLVEIHMGSSSKISDALKFNTRYSIEIDRDFLTFDDPECFTYVDKGEWNFTTGVVTCFNEENIAKANVNLAYWFDFDTVDFSKSSFEYDWNMAVFAYMTTLSAFESATAAYAIDTGKHMDDYDGAANARTFLVDRLGFEKFAYNNGYKNKPTYESVGVCAASKKMRIGGKDYTLIVLPIRGAGYGAEWSSNAKVGNGTNHAGFDEASDKAIEFLEDYIEENKIKGNIKVLVTGYSRAGGTTNLVAAKLDHRVLKNTSIKTATLRPKDIYGYCFEPPATTKDDNRRNLRVYGNIHSFINQRDLIPMVPGSAWGYGRYGKEYYFKDVDFTMEGNRGAHGEVLRQYTKMAGHDPEKEFKITGIYVNNRPVNASEWTEYVITGLSDVLQYSNFLKIQPILEDVLKDGLGTPMGQAVMDRFYDLVGNLAYEYRINENHPFYSMVNAVAFILEHPNELCEGQIRTNLSSGILLKFLDRYNKKYDALDSAFLYEKMTPLLRQKKILESIVDSFNTDIVAQEHYPLLNFAWLLYYKDKELTEMEAHYKKIYVNCPVDVEVYDEENRLVATIINDEVKVIDNKESRSVDIVSFLDENQQKVIKYPEYRNYSIEIKATGDGTMDFAVENYVLGEGVTKRLNYMDIPINVGTQLSASENASGDIILSKEGVELKPVITAEIVKCNITLSSDGNGYTIGSGEYTRYEYVDATAIAYADGKFEGWYSGNILVSKDEKYRFRVEKDTTLTAKFMSNDGIRVTAIEPQQYSGFALKPDIDLYDGSQLLTLGTDYTLSYKNNVNAFEFTDANKLTDAQKKKAPQIIIKMKGNYAGQKTVYFSIAPLSIVDNTSFEASLKKGKKPAVVFKFNGKALKENTDYTVAETTDKSATVIGKGNFTGTQKFSFAKEAGTTIVAMSKATVEKISAQVYTGTALNGSSLKNTIKVFYPKGNQLEEGKDYKITKIINPVKVGTATVVIKGLKAGGQYSFTGEKRISVKIVQKAITGATVTGADGKTSLTAVFNKAGAKPEGLTVTVDGKTLRAGRDYTIQYSANTRYYGTGDVSTKDGKLKITGKGNYKGSKQLSFKITKKSFTTEAGITVVAVNKPQAKKAGAFSTKVMVFDSEGKLLKAGEDYDKNIVYTMDGVKELDKNAFPKAGDVVTVRVKGAGGYKAEVISTTCKILKAGESDDISKAKITITPFSYNNGVITLTGDNASHIKGTFGKNKTKLTFSTDGVTGDFMVVPGSYVGNDKKGTAKVTFVGINGYSGIKTVSFKIGTRSLSEWWKGLFQ